MERVTLTQKEQTRLKVLNSVLVYQVPACQTQLNGYNYGDMLV